MPMTDAEPRQDAFPDTRRTWIDRVLEVGDLAAVSRHVMEVYAEPLRVYCSGCSLRWVGDPADLVAGFFADRLSRPAFIDRWRESRRPLRFWLIVGFKHYLFEEARRQRRGSSALDPAHEQGDPEPDRAFEQQCAIALVRDAAARAEQRCRAAGLEDHWAVFARFYLRDEPISAIASGVNLTPARVAVMKRTAARHFRDALRELIAWKGAGDEEIDAEIRSLMGALA
jgi:hypothetical protein